MTRVLTVLAGLALAAGPASSDDAATYDVRGPLPKVGTVVVRTTKSGMKDADLKLKGGGNELPPLKVSRTETEEAEVELLKFANLELTKYKTKVVKNRLTESVKFGEEESKESDKDGPLAGQVVVSEKGEKAWTHTLAEGKPSEEQADELEDYSVVDLGYEPVPAGKIAVGKTWEVGPDYFKRFLGSNCTDAGGKLTCKFTGVKLHGGEQCAVIETTGTMKATIGGKKGEKKVVAEVKLTTLRSLKTGLEVRSEGDIGMQMSGKEKTDEDEFDLDLKGKMTLVETNAFKK